MQKLQIYLHIFYVDFRHWIIREPGQTICEAILGNDAATGVPLAETRLGAPDAKGRRRPELVPGSEQDIEADAVIIAFGCRPNPPEWLLAAAVETHEDGRLRVGESGRLPHQTSPPGIFAGGDVVRGADLVVTAVFEGREAAKGILEGLGVGGWVIRPGFPGGSSM